MVAGGVIIGDSAPRMNLVTIWADAYRPRSRRGAACGGENALTGPESFARWRVGRWRGRTWATYVCFVTKDRAAEPGQGVLDAGGASPGTLGATWRRDRDGVVTVVVAGEVDLATRDRLAAVLTRALTELRPARLVVDLARVPFMDAAGLGVLMAARRRAERTGVGLAVAHPSPMITLLLRLTGLLALLDQETPDT